MKHLKAKESYFGLTFIATGEDTNGKYFLSKTTVPARDFGPPPHTHAHESESFYLQKGQLVFNIDGKSIELNPGEYLKIESGEKHSWKNVSETDAELLIIFAPAGIEGMFVELENNMANLKLIGEKYGTIFY